MRKKIWIAIPLLLVVGVGIYVFRHTVLAARAVSAKVDPKNSNGKPGGRGGAKNGEGPPPIPVVAVRAKKGNIGIYFEGVGSVTPIYTVTVKSRVDGQLINVHYHEGDLVHKGDLLIEIDPRPYQAALTQAEGQLARDQALLNNAKVDLARYQSLVPLKAIPEQQLATQEATVQQYEGVVKVDQGAIENAKVNLGYTRIEAPITGRVGLRLVDPGNIVHASDTNGLLVITQMDPISVLFTVAEDQLPQVLAKIRQGQMLEADAYDRDMKKRIAQGTLTTVDNQIDQSTGTIRIRAVFDNKDGVLFPNQFVNVRLLVEEHRNVVLLNTAAIQRTTNSAYVDLIKPDSTVAVRNISIGATEGENSEITSGLQAGDVVVMTGADKLQEGSRVNAQIQGERQGEQGGEQAGAEARGQ